MLQQTGDRSRHDMKWELSGWQTSLHRRRPSLGQWTQFDDWMAESDDDMNGQHMSVEDKQDLLSEQDRRDLYELAPPRCIRTRRECLGRRK